jgi:hypothetical protein
VADSLDKNILYIVKKKGRVNCNDPKTTKISITKALGWLSAVYIMLTLPSFPDMFL